MAKATAAVFLVSADELMITQRSNNWHSSGRYAGFTGQQKSGFDALQAAAPV
ncbi:hypothetical protein [Psychromonas sp.]|uniref:hypothetical protein n=1 Tax=Psychromonas sp. TaxID=1884585 RepID=UPI0035622079